MKTKRSERVFVLFCLVCIGCFGQRDQPVVEDIYKNTTCIWETFSANCAPNKVIMIVEALLGRMSNGSGCLNLNPGEQSCSADVRLFAERQCAGRRQCSFKPINDNLKLVAGNCSLHAQKYLIVSYRCEDVYSADNETCVANQSMTVSSMSGYLANIITEETGKGSSICPWRFELRMGQTVRLTLLDFGVWVDRSERGRRDICRIYASIHHLGSQGTPDTLICAGDNRERSIMTTTTDLEIRMTKSIISSTNIPYFLIKFQIFDCPEILTPPGAEIEKTGSGIRVYCYDDRRIYMDLRCQAGHWSPQPDLTCITTSTTSVDSSLCSQFVASGDISSIETKSRDRRLIICSNGESFEMICLNRSWISLENKSCSKPAQDQTQTDNQSLSWEKYLVPGGLLLLAVVVIIIVVIMCKSRRRDKKTSTPQALDNNCYFTAIPLGYGDTCRPTSGLYDELDEGRMGDNGNIAPLPGCSSSNPVCGPPRGSRTLPRNDPWTGCSSLVRRSDSLPYQRQVPEPHEYTTPLPRDSTYLVPKEDLCDPHNYDSVPSKGKI